MTQEVEMRWIDVNDALPGMHEEVIVWVRYEGRDDFEFTQSFMDYDGWAMGSAENFQVTHWMRIDGPSA